MSKKLSVGILLLISLLFSTNSVSAHAKQDVLGDSTQAAQLSFANVTAGPGVILPTSPFFFIDKIYQQVKLVLATTPEAKAKVRAEIIGERMAEVKAMILKNNENGLNKALKNLTDESDQAAQDLTSQAEKGKDVTDAAKTLNESLKQEQTVLTSLADNTSGSLGFTFRSAREKVKMHKEEVADRLPDALSKREKEDGLKLDIEEQASQAAKATFRIKKNVQELEKYSSDAAMRREKILQEKNKKLTKDQQTLLQMEMKRKEELKRKQQLLREKANKAADATTDLQQQTEDDNLDSLWKSDDESKSATREQP